MYRLEQVIIYVRHSKQGKVFTKLVSIDNATRANVDQLFEMILKKIDEAYHWKPPLVPLTGSEFEWNNWAAYQIEDESDDDGPSVRSVEHSDALLSPLASNSEDISLDIEINQLINEESSHSHIVDDSLDLPLMIGITSDGANVFRGKKNDIHKKN